MEHLTTTAVLDPDPEDSVDFTAHYWVADMPGVAFYLRGWAVQWVPVTSYVPDPDDPEGDWIEVDCGEVEAAPDYGFVRAVMVGDDREHLVDVDDLAVLGEHEYCLGCGQTGCHHYRLEADDE